VLKHKFGIENKVVVALSCIGCLLQIMRVEVLGFDKIKNTCSSCPDFGRTYSDSELLVGNRRSNVELSTLFSMTVICFEVLNYESSELYLEPF